jgi:hypothetical protein
MYSQMSKRFHCEFNNCNCSKFIKHGSDLCFLCQHSSVWHSSTSSKSTTNYHTFQSPRKLARKPVYAYTQSLQIAVFVPFNETNTSIPVATTYCNTFENLPL